MRRRLASGLPLAGLPKAASPVSGFSRMIVPSSESICGSEERKLCARRPPPFAPGGVWATPGESLHGSTGSPLWP